MASIIMALLFLVLDTAGQPKNSGATFSPQNYNSQQLKGARIVGNTVAVTGGNTGGTWRNMGANQQAWGGNVMVLSGELDD